MTAFGEGRRVSSEGEVAQAAATLEQGLLAAQRKGTSVASNNATKICARCLASEGETASIGWHGVSSRRRIWRLNLRPTDRTTSTGCRCAG